MGRVLDEKFRATWTCLNYQDLVVFSERFTEITIKDCIHILQLNGYDDAAESLISNFGNKE
jgi:hypothetical protein